MVDSRAMSDPLDVVIVGAGQAGLATSHELAGHGISHRYSHSQPAMQREAAERLNALLGRSSG
jgi:2-polyprenyl-6-methoxyphenol hydroxylase-like FAD-dependent oxidoreductase